MNIKYFPAIIAGTGVGLKPIRTSIIKTDYPDVTGNPNIKVHFTTIGGEEIPFINRHEGFMLPSYVNTPGQMQALLEVGANAIVATTACGKLSEEVDPGNLVILDSFAAYDDLGGRKRTITEPGVLFIHAPSNDLYDSKIRDILIKESTKIDFLTEMKDIYKKEPSLGISSARVHERGLMVVIGGPRFASAQEEVAIRHIFNEINCPKTIAMTSDEAIVAREFALPYASIGIVTDSSSFYYYSDPERESVSHNSVKEIMISAGAIAGKLLVSTVESLMQQEFDDTYQRNILSASILPGTYDLNALEKIRPNTAKRFRQLGF